MNSDEDPLLLLTRNSMWRQDGALNNERQLHLQNLPDTASHSPQSQVNLQLFPNHSRAESLSSSAHQSRSVHARPSLEHAESLLFLAEGLQRYVSSYTELCVSIRGPLRDVIFDLKAIQTSHQQSLMVAENVSDPSANFPISPTSPPTPPPHEVVVSGRNSPQTSVISSFWSTPSPASPIGVGGNLNAPVVSGKLLIIGPPRSGKTTVLALLEASQLTETMKDMADEDSDTGKDEKDSTKFSDAPRNSSVVKGSRMRAKIADEGNTNDSFEDYYLTSPRDDDAQVESICSDDSVSGTTPNGIRIGGGVVARDGQSISPFPGVSPVVTPVITPMTTSLSPPEQPNTVTSGTDSSRSTISKQRRKDSPSELNTRGLSKERQRGNISGILKDSMSVNTPNGLQAQLSRQASVKNQKSSQLRARSGDRHQGSSVNALQSSNTSPQVPHEEGRDTDSSTFRKTTRTSDTHRSSRARITTTTTTTTTMTTAHPPPLSPVSPMFTSMTIGVRPPEENAVVSPFGSALSGSRSNRERHTFEDATQKQNTLSRLQSATKNNVVEGKDTSEAACKSPPFQGMDNPGTFSTNSASKRDFSSNFLSVSARNSTKRDAVKDGVESGEKQTLRAVGNRSPQQVSPERGSESPGDTRRRVSVAQGSATDEDDVMFFNVHLSLNAPAHEGSSRYSPLLPTDPSGGMEKGMSTPQSLGALAGIRTISSMKSPSRHAIRERSTKGFQPRNTSGANGHRPSATFVSIPMFQSNPVADGRATPPVSPTQIGTFFKSEYLPRFGVETAIDVVTRFLRHRTSIQQLKLSSLIQGNDKVPAIDETEVKKDAIRTTVSADRSVPRETEAASGAVQGGGSQPKLDVPTPLAISTPISPITPTHISSIVFAKTPAHLNAFVLAKRSPQPAPPLHTLVLDTPNAEEAKFAMFSPVAKPGETGSRISLIIDSVSKRQSRHGSNNSAVSTPLYTFPRNLHARSESGSTVDGAESRKNYSFLKSISTHAVDSKRTGNGESNTDTEARTPTPRTIPIKLTSHFASSVRLIPDEEKSPWYAQETKHAAVSGDDHKFSDCARLPLVWRGDSFMLCVPCSLVLSPDVVGEDDDVYSSQDEDATHMNGGRTTSVLTSSGRDDFPLTQKSSSLVSTGAVRYDIKECVASLFGPLQRTEDSASSTPRTFATVASEDSTPPPAQVHTTFTPRSVPLAMASDKSPASLSINLDEPSVSPTSPADVNTFSRRMRQLVCDCTTFVLTFGDKASQSHVIREMEARRHPQSLNGKLHTCDYKCCCESSTAVREASQRMTSAFAKYMLVHYGVHIRRANVIVLHAPAALATIRFLRQISNAIPGDNGWQPKRSRGTVLSSLASTAAASEDNEENTMDGEWSSGDVAKPDAPSVSNLLDPEGLPTRILHKESFPDAWHAAERTLETTQKNPESGRQPAHTHDDSVLFTVEGAQQLRNDDGSASPHAGMEFAAFHKLDSTNMLKHNSATARRQRPSRTEVPATQNPSDVPNASTSSSSGSAAHTSRSDTGVFTDEPHPTTPRIIKECVTPDPHVVHPEKPYDVDETNPIDTRTDTVHAMQTKSKQDELESMQDAGGIDSEFSIGHIPITTVKSFVTPQGEQQLAFFSFQHILEDYRRTCYWNKTLRATVTSPNAINEVTFPVPHSASLRRMLGGSAEGVITVAARRATAPDAHNSSGGADAETAGGGIVNAATLQALKGELDEREELIWSAADRAVSTTWPACGGAQLIRAAQLFDRDKLQYILVRRSASIALLSLGMQTELQRAKSVSLHKLRTATGVVSEKSVLLNHIKDNKVLLHSKGQPANFSDSLSKELSSFYENVVKHFLRVLALSLNLAASMDAAAASATQGKANGGAESDEHNLHPTSPSPIKLKRPQDYLNEINEVAGPSQMSSIFRLVDSAKVALGAIQALRQDRESYVETCSGEKSSMNHDALAWTPFEVSSIPRSARGSVTGSSMLGVPRDPLSNSMIRNQPNRSRDRGSSSPFLHVSQTNLSVSLRSAMSPATLRAEPEVLQHRLSRHSELLTSMRSGVFRNYHRSSRAQLNGTVSPLRYNRSPLSVRLSREALTNSILVPTRDLLPDSKATASVAARSPTGSPGCDMKSMTSGFSRHDSSVLIAEPNDCQSQLSSSSRRSGTDGVSSHSSPHVQMRKEVRSALQERDAPEDKYREGALQHLVPRNDHPEENSHGSAKKETSSKRLSARTDESGSQFPATADAGAKKLSLPPLDIAVSVSTSESSPNTNRTPTVVLLQSVSDHGDDTQHTAGNTAAVQRRKDSQIRCAKDAEKALTQLNTEIINLFLAEVAGDYAGLTAIWEQHRQESLKKLLELVRELTIPNVVRLAHVTAIQDALRDIQQLSLAEKHQDEDLMSFIQGLRDAVTQDHLRACAQELQRIRPTQRQHDTKGIAHNTEQTHPKGAAEEHSKMDLEPMGRKRKKEGPRHDSEARGENGASAPPNQAAETEKEESGGKRMLHPQPPPPSMEGTKHHGCSARALRASNGLPQIVGFHATRQETESTFSDAFANSLSTTAPEGGHEQGHFTGAPPHINNRYGNAESTSHSEEEEDGAGIARHGREVTATPPTSMNGKRPTTSTPTRNVSPQRSHVSMKSNPEGVKVSPVHDTSGGTGGDAADIAENPPRSVWRGRSATLNPSALATQAAVLLEGSLATRSDGSTYSDSGASLVISADLNNSDRMLLGTDINNIYPTAGSPPSITAAQDVSPIFTTLFFDLHYEVQGNRSMQRADVLPAFNDAFIAFLAEQPTEEPGFDSSTPDRRGSEASEVSGGGGGGGVYNWAASSVTGASILSSPALDTLKSPRTSRYAFQSVTPRSLRASVCNTSLSLGQSHSIMFTSQENEASVLSARRIRRGASRTILAQSESIFPHLDDAPNVEDLSGLLPTPHESVCGKDDSLVCVGIEPDEQVIPATDALSDSQRRAERSPARDTGQSAERSRRSNPSGTARESDTSRLTSSRHDSPIKGGAGHAPSANDASDSPSKTARLSKTEPSSPHVSAPLRPPGPRSRRLTALPQDRRNLPRINRDKSEVPEETEGSPSVDPADAAEDISPAAEPFCESLTETNENRGSVESGSVRHVDVQLDSQLLAFVYTMWVRVSDHTRLQQWLLLHLDRYTQSLNSILVATFGELHKVQTETESSLRKARAELDTVKQESNSIQSARAASHIEEIRNAALNMAEEILTGTILNEDPTRDPS